MSLSDNFIPEIYLTFAKQNKLVIKTKRDSYEENSNFINRNRNDCLYKHPKKRRRHE